MSFKKNLLLFLLAVSFLLQAQQQSVIIDRINGKDLTNHFITSIFQDQKGYLWVGTLSGLNRYNGYGFIRFRYVPNDATTISHPAITSFNQSNNGNILVGTRRGLSIYNYPQNSFARIVLPESTKNAAGKNNIQCMVSRKSGEHLLGTHDGVLLYVDGKNSVSPVTTSQGPLLEGWRVNGMCIDRSGNLWAVAKNINPSANQNRAFRYDFTTQKLKEYVIGDGLTEQTGISEDYLGNIWVAVDHGLMNINPGTGKQTFYEAPEGFYSNVAYTHTRDNTIWQSYWSFGITAFDIDKKEFRVYRNDPDNSKSLMSNKCWALFKDDNEIMWIGSDVGLQKITSKRPAIKIVRRNSKKPAQSFLGNIISSVHASRKQNNIILAGIDGEGFSVYNSLTNEALNFGPRSTVSNPERFVNQFLEDDSGDIYIIGQNAFQKMSFTEGKPSVKNYYGFQEHYAACGVQDPQNPDRLWIGCRGEIFSFDKKLQKLTFYPEPEGISSVFYSVFISHGNIYFGHRNGILKIDPVSNAFSKVVLAEAGNITSAQSLSEDEVYLSSQYFGLIKFFPRSGKYEIIHKGKNEFFSEPSDLMLYKSNLWLTGNRGITGINLLDHEITELTTEDGLPADVVHSIDLLDGYFYLATQDGLAIVNPDFQVSHFIAPRVDVTRFQVLTDTTLFQNLETESEIILKEEQNSFRIDFTVLDFNLPEKNRFKFRFPPIEKDWQKPVAENFVIFNSLPPGTYKFELIGSNADQIWSNEPFVINIRIVPPFYKTTWFIVLFISMLILSGVVFVWLRLRADHKKQVMLEKIIRERTAEIRAQRAELLDSISYAQRIQKAIFVGEAELKQNISDSFIYYRSRDKVSGDFYWIGKYRDMLIVFAGDCTGHGVPGAMLSIVGTTLLNKIVHEEEICLPGEILTRLNYLFYRQLTLDVDNIRDGMDASVMTLNLVNGNAYYAGARLDAVYVQNNEVVELKAQRSSIGEYPDTSFTTQTPASGAGRFYYLFSDGLKDQHGGAEGKKLGGKRFRSMLLKAAELSPEDQKHYIGDAIDRWKAGLPQTDDMILIGFKI